MLPGVYEPTIFDPPRETITMASRFIKPIHPKTMIAPEEGMIRKVMASGWWGQPKIHGHRAQIHIPSDDSPCLAFNRHGKFHKESLPAEIQDELRRVFRPSSDWNVIDAEWIKPQKMLYVFDFLKHEGKVLDDHSFSERYELIPKFFLSPHMTTLPVFKTPERCLSYLESDLSEIVEGLVFRAAFSRGFSDHTIVRCRIASRSS